ncbi:glycosyl transferase [Actinomadura sp. NBRC 104412]|uniref:glycosyltransferase n=1 Tax=Actinomadura sp. NBRC 104412 TaxID=3032203 RepID=UPI0024A2F6BC|nr:glycosyltransferase [Actinomadura sp. NBRC 104412]GLZ07421.1 glycosyl transferase [Actinomadura sp. NBRC 104412]
MTGPPRPRVVAALVTHQRRDLLSEALTALAEQSRPPDATIVVDNASTDGTALMVREAFPAVELVRLERNTGGAGGFAVALSRALELDADLVWLMDDDTVPRSSALEALLEARERATPSPALVASRVVWTDGRAHPMNTPRTKPRARRWEREAAESAGCEPIRSASFVSVLVDADAARRCGPPVADYFLWNDDFEFTTRLLRGGLGLLCPRSEVVHKTGTFGSTDADPGDRFFYEVRNKVWLFTRSRGLAPGERVLYALSTVRRWGRTFLRSSDRATLRRCLVRGLASGLKAGPRPNSRVLGDLTTSAQGRGGP